MKRTENQVRIRITVRDGKVVSVYEVADPGQDIEVRLEKGEDYTVWEL
jgi:hypothetical protein